MRHRISRFLNQLFHRSCRVCDAYFEIANRLSSFFVFREFLLFEVWWVKINLSRFLLWNDSNVFSWFLSIFRRDVYREILIARHKLHLELRSFLLWKRRKDFYEILFFSLFIMKLKRLTNNDVMIKFRFRISSFRRLLDFRVFFIRIIFDFKVDRVFLHFLDFCHEIYDDSKHQVIIQYCIRKEIIDSFERVIFFFTNASIIFVLCRFWIVDWDSCFATMNHDVEWIRKKFL
jgi:hypothetical protein